MPSIHQCSKETIKEGLASRFNTSSQSKILDNPSLHDVKADIKCALPSRHLIIIETRGGFHHSSSLSSLLTEVIQASSKNLAAVHTPLFSCVNNKDSLHRRDASHIPRETKTFAVINAFLSMCVSDKNFIHKRSAKPSCKHPSRSQDSCHRSRIFFPCAHDKSLFQAFLKLWCFSMKVFHPAIRESSVFLLDARNCLHARSLMTRSFLLSRVARR
ncbi:UNVERIFIED_CONTAM: hypothetical protein Sradi_5287500 [Sesamum radiatum]|uniref:Uncharacterized protein n=1 Tax=Sesamum radiatum TaxID=300843 RepID=A0AAW2LPK6_SESRA